jgi:hypothetical protein
VIYFCSQQKRRARVLQHPTLNGIDYLEVCDSGEDCGCGKRLLLTFLKDARQISLDASQIRITGGAADAQVQVVNVLGATDDAPTTLTVVLNAPGDFSTYTLTLTANSSTSDPPDGLDPQLSAVEFSFKAGCPTVGDCAPDSCCPPAPVAEPDVNYLAKEFDGFTQVILDRLAVLVPGWSETHPPDIGIALVETLAYAADHLSYQQDAVATEAYLGTARSRISLRRHAKLVDYRLDEGANARTWIYVEAAQDGLVLPQGTAMYPRVPGLPTVVNSSNNKQLDQLSTALAFETMEEATLRLKHNLLQFYTWGDASCCLPAGSTQATLFDHFPDLTAGAVLIFEEQLGPETGDPDDADPAKRWVVRLTQIQQTDHAGRALIDPIDGTPVTRIWWDPVDALPFPLCLSATLAVLGAGSTLLPNVSVALGNIIPADHGVWLGWEDLGAVPAAPEAPVATASCQCGGNSTVDAPRVRYFPSLAHAPLTFTTSFDATAPASTFLTTTAVTQPQLQVRDDLQRPWTVLEDLLSAHESDMAVVAEIERDGTVYVRFGDGEYGMAANAAASFQAYYRVGNGSAGNIGRDTLAHLVMNKPGIRSLRNPLPAQGGRDAETMEHIRQRAPFAFRSQQRAVTEDDYGMQAESDPAIHEARGTLRWTGGWYTAFVSIDPAAGQTDSAALAKTTKARLNLLRMAGVDLDVEGAVIVGLRIEMDICVSPEHFQGDVYQAVMRLCVTGDLCSGQRGILNPENFTFGETVYASPLVAAAQSVEGVTSAALTLFQRMDDPTLDGAAQSFLTMHRLEIARCDNDPDRLDHGIFVLHMDGGR